LTVAAKKDGEVETRDVQLEASSSGNVEGNLELSSPANIPVEALPVRLRTSSVPFPWFHAKEARSDIFPFPETDDERNRAQVFYDLWKKGLFLSSGSKFGANYLAYPGKLFCDETLGFGGLISPLREQGTLYDTTATTRCR
jgi:hypothetical protein